MKIKRITPNLMSDDMQKTHAYYTEILGFEMTMSVPEEPPYAWMAVEKDGKELMFQSRDSMAEEQADYARESIGEGFALFMEIEGIDELHTKLTSMNYLIQKEMHTTFYGMREFTVKDNNGYLLVFAERVEG